MTDFEQMKQFFLQHRERLVDYNLINSNARKCEKYLPEYVYKNIIHNPDVKDFFVLNFPFDVKSGLVNVDSLDSFVFDFYFVDYGDKIVIDDAERTFDCGVESYEGNGVILAQKDVTEKYLLKNGLQYSNYAIIKQTNIQTFVQDTITFVKVLQTLNNAQPYPPYILELDDAREVVEVLTRCWIYGEKSEKDENARKLALFDNQKILQENGDCEEGAYPPFFNKHAFVGVFFNSDGKVLVRKSGTETESRYDFAIHDYVLKDECCSLVGIQRAIQQSFGFDFYFGDVAPALTTTRNRLICDFYVVRCYDVSTKQLCGDGENTFDWMGKDDLFALLNADRFANYPVSLLECLYEL
ncbi:MAG: hypothetical protein E7609_01730 [Ruminococcaceae bacterium]|nr:hypothetical protein [Oscillospiraceae bacterium]